MKKLLAAVLTAIIALSALFAAAAAETPEILFRNIPFGSDAETVSEAVREDGIGFSLFDPALVAASYICMLASENYSLYALDTGISTFSIDTSAETEVEGYTPSRISIFFIYRPVDGRLVTEDQYTALYAGEYEFSTDNPAELLQEMKEKLAGIYGPCKYEGGEELLPGLFGESNITFLSVDPAETFAIWESDKAYLILKATDIPDDSDSSYYSDKVELTYVTKDTDRWIREALDAQKNS